MLTRQPYLSIKSSQSVKTKHHKTEINKASPLNVGLKLEKSCQSPVLGISASLPDLSFALTNCLTSEVSFNFLHLSSLTHNNGENDAPLAVFL